MEAAAHRWFLALALVVGLLAPFAAPSRTAFACSCAVPPSLADQIETATVAFSGKVEEILPDGPGPGGELHVRVEFEAEEFWKGEPTRTVVVYTANSSAACGFRFIEGSEYFVLARGTERLETNLCLFNVDLDEGPEADIQAVEALGDGQKPGRDAPPSQGDGGSGGGDGGEQPPGSENGGPQPDSTGSNVDPDPLNVGLVLLSALVAAGAVVVVARRN